MLLIERLCGSLTTFTAQLWFEPFGQRREMFKMALPDRLRLAGSFQHFQGMFTNGFQHPKPPITLEFE